MRWIQKVEAGDINIKNVTVKRFTLLMKGISSLSEQSKSHGKLQNQVETINGTYKMVAELLKEELA